MPLICSSGSEDNSPQTSPQCKSQTSVFVLTVLVCLSYVCLFLCVSGDKNDEEGMEMDEEIFQIMVIYSLYQAILLHFGSILDFFFI